MLAHKMCCLFSKSQLNEGQPNVVKEEDLQYLIQLVKMKGGGPPWIHMMHRVMPNMSYQAWWRDPKVRFSCIVCWSPYSFNFNQYIDN